MEIWMDVMFARAQRGRVKLSRVLDVDRAIPILRSCEWRSDWVAESPARRRADTTEAAAS